MIIDNGERIKNEQEPKRVKITLCICLIFSLFVLDVSAATTNIGATTHDYTYVEPVYFRLQGDVTYSELHDNIMAITSMQSRVWNYSSSAVEMTAPTFIAETGTQYHSTNSSMYYNTLSIPSNTSNYYTNVNWQSFLDAYYNGDSSTYTIPRNANQTDSALITSIGIYAGNYYSGGLAYNYSAYWHGDGYIKIRDAVANTPYWTSKTVNTVNSSTLSYSLREIDSSSTMLANKDEKLAFAITVEGQESLQFVTPPVIATDQNFKDILEIDPDDIEIVNGNTMYVSVPLDRNNKPVYIKMPDVTLIDSDYAITSTNTANIESKEILDTKNNVRIIELKYSNDTFPVTPKSATLLPPHNSQKIECFSSTVYYDENNDVIGGSFAFCVPEDFTLEEGYNLLLQGKLVDVEGGIYEVTIQ